MTASLEPTTTTPVRTPRSAVAVSTEVVLFGHLAWLAWFWVLATAVYAVALMAVHRYGEVERGFWQSTAAGWQRWVLIAAGVSTTFSLVRMVLPMGVTRKQFALGTIFGGALLVTATTAFVSVGYLVESLLYERNDWPFVLAGSADPVARGDLLQLALETLLVFAAYFVSGWLVGLAYYRSSVLGVLLLLPCLVPAALVDVLLTPEFASTDLTPLGPNDRPAVALCLLAGVAILAAATTVAAWATRRLTFTRSS